MKVTCCEDFAVVLIYKASTLGLFASEEHKFVKFFPPELH